MIVMEIKKLVRIVTLVAIVSLTGCMLGPDFKKSVIKTPDHYRFADKEAKITVGLKWWELFNDPVLGSLVTAALQDNKEIRIAASRIEEARASLGFTRADSYPRLDLEADASRGNSSGGRKLGYTDNHFFIAPALRWEIDFWGKFRRATESSMAELMASEYALRTVQISLITEVVSTYFMLLDYHERLEISQHTLASRVDALDIIEKRFSKGIIPEIDVNQAQIQKETAAIAIPIYERLIAKAEHTLSILLGRLPGEIEKGMSLYRQTIPPDIPVGLPSSLLERRPDILRAEHLVEAQSARIGVAQALRLPSISLTGILGGASDELSTLTSGGAAWSVSASLFGPIFNFNQDKMRVEIEKERTKQALYEYENTVLLAFGEVEDALNEIHTYKRQISAIEKKFKAAKNAAVLSKMRYDKGVVSFLEVLDTERALFAVELELSETKQEFYNAYVKLYKALGGGWLSGKEMEEAEKDPGMG
ncbi:MAG: efflux transporter outer membrane subunit [Deltaproteobacteria bacterium]|nr:efflux transporter outer membrane subunit [Deltaproteobacteria bacterium]